MPKGIPKRVKIYGIFKDGECIFKGSRLEVAEHFATYPEELVEPCILAGSRMGGVVLDPFFGSGTTGRVAERLGRKWIGIELNEKYIEIAKKRTDNVQTQLLF